jgi:hypothetical protein
MQPGMFTATALADGAPLWGQRPGAPEGSMRPTSDHPEVARRVPAGTRVAVHTTPAFGGFWWQVQGGPAGGLLVRQHDPAWSVNG